MPLPYLAVSSANLTRALLATSLALALGGCSTWGGDSKSTSDKKGAVYLKEGFENNETFSRLFDAPVDATCEAARRALLSQGYLLSTVRPDFVNGSKSFQPEGEVHVQITFHVVCTPEGKEGRISTAFVNAVQDRYALKKNANSASVGLSAIGSVSIPLSSTEDSLVKVASETIPAGQFYDRFFALMTKLMGEPGTVAN